MNMAVFCCCEPVQGCACIKISHPGYNYATAFMNPPGGPPFDASSNAVPAYNQIPGLALISPGMTFDGIGTWTMEVQALAADTSLLWDAIYQLVTGTPDVCPFGTWEFVSENCGAPCPETPPATLTTSALIVGVDVDSECFPL